MKRIVTIALAMAMLLSLLAGCKPANTEEEVL